MKLKAWRHPNRSPMGPFDRAEKFSFELKMSYTNYNWDGDQSGLGEVMSAFDDPSERFIGVWEHFDFSYSVIDKVPSSEHGDICYMFFEFKLTFIRRAPGDVPTKREVQQWVYGMALDPVEGFEREETTVVMPGENLK